MTKASCWTHPAFSQVGVCAACLRERLEQLCIDELHCANRCSFDSNSSSAAVATAAPPAELDNGAAAAATISSMVEADRAAVAESLAGMDAAPPPPPPMPKFATFLQRTHSWSSSSRTQRNGFSTVSGAGQFDSGTKRTLARIISGSELCGESLPPSGFLLSEDSCKFNLCDTPKGHYKASSWPEIESSSSSHKHGDQGMKSWIASFFGIRSRSKDPASKISKSGELKERKKFFKGLGRKKNGSNLETSSVSSQNNSRMMDNADESFDQHGLANGSSKVMPLSGSGEYSFQQKPSLTNMRSVNGRSSSSKPPPPPPPPPKDPRASWSTPLRKFMLKSPKSDIIDSESLQEDEMSKNSSWNISSPAPESKRFHPSPAFPTNSSYTAYYRDYGSSWSLHSSPMPGSKARWNQQYHHNQQRSRPWEANRDNFHLHSSSPFHAAGSNTWNFYLTPLRPGRSTVSRHRT